MSELPKEFHALKPHEVEDVLCIFKDELAASRLPTRSDPTCRSWCG